MNVIRNPEECSQGLIDILASPDCFSETTIYILHSFSEAPLCKIVNHELLVCIARRIQMIICGLRSHTDTAVWKEESSSKV